MNFPNPLSQSTSSTKKTNPDSSRSLLLLSQGTSLTRLPEGPPTQLRPSTISPISRTQKRPAQSPTENVTVCPATDLPRAGQAPTQGIRCTRMSEPLGLHPSKSKGEHLPSRPSWRLQPRRKSLRGSQTGKEPGTNAATTDCQWREFYYYPIITLGSVPK